MPRRSSDADAGTPEDRSEAHRLAPRARREVRTIRRVELWSVFRLAACVYGAVYVLGLLTFALLWWIASNTGTTGNIESFLRDVGFKGFTFKGGQLFLGALLAGAVLAIAATLLTTVLAAMVNLISELTGGVQVVVVEAEPHVDAIVQLAPDTRRAEPGRAGPPPLATPAAQQVDEREDGAAASRPAPANGPVPAEAGRWSERAAGLLRGSATGSHRP